MPRNIIRTAATAIAIAALAAPTALARPADMLPAGAKAAAAAQNKQDARSADADGFPTRPVIDRSPANLQRDATPQAPTDPGSNWTTIAIGIAGSLLALGAITGITSRTRRSGRARITA